MSCIRSVLILICALGLTACGGSGGGDGDSGPAVMNLVLPGDADLDGIVFVSGAAFSSTAPGAGDTSTDQLARGVFAFRLAGLPAGAQIQQAVLRIAQSRVIGDPYGQWGPLVVDHLRVGPTLDGGDFTGNQITVAIGLLSSNGALGYKELDVTQRVIADIASSRLHSAYLVRFASAQSSDNQGDEDIALFGDTEDTLQVGTPPQLVIRYTLP